MITSKIFHFDQLQLLKTAGLKIQKMQLQFLLKFPQFFRSHPVTIVTNCVQNCEFLMAYKLRRGQQMFSLYTKLWGEARLKDLLSQMRKKLIRQFAERTTTFMCAGAFLTTFDWEKNRIPEKYMKGHYKDLEHIKFLTEKTMTCPTCKQRLVVDTPCYNVVYCECVTSEHVYNKEFEGTTWVPFIERQDLLVWRRLKPDDRGLYEYKLFGVYDEVYADLFLKVQIDTEYRKEWDSTAVEIKVIDSDPASNSDILYWEMQWPKFFSNRDYVFNRRYIVDKEKNVIVLTSQITDHPNVPESTDKFRVKEYYCTMVIKPLTKLDQPGVEFCMTYFDNPGLAIPGPVQTWVATSAMPDFLGRLRMAARGYKTFSPGPCISWPEEHGKRTVLDDFSTMFLVEDTPRKEEISIFNVFRDCFFAT